MAAIAPFDLYASKVREELFRLHRNDPKHLMDLGAWMVRLGFDYGNAPADVACEMLSAAQVGQLREDA